MEIKEKILLDIGKIADSNNINAYVVGGYVRNQLLGNSSDDMDIMVIGDGVEFAEKVASSLGAELSAVYKNFGTALLNYNNYKIEFASARKESYSRDSRKPDVEFSGMEDDLARRDFTINAMAVSLNKDTLGELTDLFGGMEDLKNKIIRTPLPPEKTFDDDPLRIMRAIRFASVLNFTIEPGTYDAIIKMKDRLKKNENRRQRCIAGAYHRRVSEDPRKPEAVSRS